MTVAIMDKQSFRKLYDERAKDSTRPVKWKQFYPARLIHADTEWERKIPETIVAGPDLFRETLDGSTAFRDLRDLLCQPYRAGLLPLTETAKDGTVVEKTPEQKVDKFMAGAGNIPPDLMAIGVAVTADPFELAFWQATRDGFIIEVDGIDYQVVDKAPLPPKFLGVSGIAPLTVSQPH